jgi:hypothetical protein
VEAGNRERGNTDVGKKALCTERNVLAHVQFWKGGRQHYNLGYVFRRDVPEARMGWKRKLRQNREVKGMQGHMQHRGAP